MDKAQEKIMIQKAQEYANKQGDAEYESSLEDFIEGFKQAFALYGAVGQSEHFYCVSSDALVHGKPCEKWCGDENCKTLCKQ